MKSFKVLLGLTTTPGSNWKEKIKESYRYNITEVALFPTFLDLRERGSLYEMLEDSPIVSAPVVHLRDDMNEYELEMFIRRYKTKLFNIHPNKKGEKFLQRMRKFSDIIFIENNYQEKKFAYFNDEWMMKNQAGGVCLDLSHLEEERIFYPDIYKKTVNIVKRFPIDFNHVSPFGGNENRNDGGRVSSHFLTNWHQLNYLKNMPVNFFAGYIALEMENCFREQIIIKKMVEGILKEKSHAE